MNKNLQSLPSVLNLIHCKSPFDYMNASCYQGLTDKIEFTDFISDCRSDGSLREMNLSESDRYCRLLKVYYHDNLVIHARINMQTGIVSLICYSLFTDKLTQLDVEYLVLQIRQHLDQY